MKGRIARLKRKMREKGLETLLITSPQNWRYLTGFSGSEGILLISEKGVLLGVDFRYYEQALSETEGLEVVRIEGSPLETFRKRLSSLEVSHLGFESSHLSFRYYKKLKKTLKLKLIPTENIVEEMRVVKDEEEIKKIKRAIKISEIAWEKVLKTIKAGMKERDVAAELDYCIKREGGEGVSFPTIVLSGRRSSLPHGHPGDKILKKGEVLLLDFGAIYQGYRCDLTRTVVLGRMTKRQREIYRLVFQAQKEAINRIKPGVKPSTIDRIARIVISKAGWSGSFGHGTGHGIGLEIHEAPHISPRGKGRLRKNMVFTVEPGIYIPGWGGIRIEDDVVVTGGGCEVLSHSPPEPVVV